MSTTPSVAGAHKTALCYVLMPFSAELKSVYEAIKTAIADAGVRLGRTISCHRGDEIADTGSIAREIINSIFHADVVVADLSGNNPNVFYELGVAHSMGNKTIMITQACEAVPFDVNAYRFIKYQASPEGLTALRSELVAS